MNIVNIGQNIRRLRTERGLSETDLAARAGIREADVLRYERNANRPRIETAARLAHALGVTLDDLIGAKNRAAI